jgi:hypothetical protein
MGNSQCRGSKGAEQNVALLRIRETEREVREYTQQRVGAREEGYKDDEGGDVMCDRGKEAKEAKKRVKRKTRRVQTIPGPRQTTTSGNSYHQVS